MARLLLLGLLLWTVGGCSTPQQQAPRQERQRWAVLVHGIFGSPSHFNQLKPRLEAANWRILPITLAPNDGTASLRQLAIELKQTIDQSIPPTDEIMLVGFSMGGMVCRSYVQEYEGWRRARGLLTIAAPNHGTQWSRLLRSPGMLEMAPGSAFLQSINQTRLHLLQRVAHGSIYSSLDGVIIPARNGRLPSGWNHQLSPMLHARMLNMNEALDAAIYFMEFAVPKTAG